MNLVIVESPNKGKTIREILRKLPGEWEVAASVGHIRDLPEREIGVAPPDFLPTYYVTEDKKKVVENLTALVRRAQTIYLATDPDREGESISWHLQQALNISNPHRITFNEVTESAVLNAIKNPRKINMNLVAAQEARRVLDRFAGYMCSLPVSQLAGEKASAGRVQSPALRLLVDREEAIKVFKPTDHCGVVLKFDGGWSANWVFSHMLEKDQQYWLDVPFANRVAKLRDLKVVKATDAEAKESPPAPFISVSLQKAASITLKFKPDVTMKLAQNLFAAGHITYHRTDNPNLTPECVADIFAYGKKMNFPMAPSHRKFPTKANAQEGHPAITPKHLEIEEIGDTADERALYKLIRQRAIASQMADALYDARKVELESVDELDGKKMKFSATGRTLRFAGWRSLTKIDAESEEDEKGEASNPIPKLIDGSQVNAIDGEVKLKKTQPPSRYTEASLLEALDKGGIGRPSTFASIIATLAFRKYYEEVKSPSKIKTIKPTPKGEKIIQVMRGKFSFVEYDYTKKMEEDLDKICDGSCDYLTVVNRGHSQIVKELNALAGAIKATYASPSGQVHSCPACSKPMSKRTASKGPNAGKFFWSCTGYPACNKTMNHNEERNAPV